MRNTYCKRVGAAAAVAVMLAAVGPLASGTVAGAAGAGNYAVVAGNGGTSSPPSTSGTGALATGINGPEAVAADPEGNVLVAEGNEIDVVAVSSANPGYSLSGQWVQGSVYRLAGGGQTTPTTSGVSASSAVLNLPSALAVDSSGNVVIADSDANKVEVLAVSSSQPGYADAAGSWTSGELYVIAGNGSTTPPPSSGAGSTAVGLNTPEGLAFDAGNNLIIDDSGHRQVDLLADGSGSASSLNGAPTIAAHLYVLMGGGTNAASTNGVASDLVQLNSPGGLSVDSSGNVLVADTGNSTIDVLAVGNSGAAYGRTGGNWVVGDVYAVVGGGGDTPSPLGTPASATSISHPAGVSVDAQGDPVVADGGDSLVEVLATASTNPGYALGAGAVWTPGDLYVIAGGGQSAPSAGGGVALSSNLDHPASVSVTARGSLVVADTFHDELESLVTLPGAPAITNATAGDGSVSLSWSAPAHDGGEAITGYEILAYAGASQTPSASSSVGPSTLSAEVGGLTDSTSYRFVVEAENALGAGASSPTVTATPQASATAGGSVPGEQASSGPATGTSGSGSSGSSASSPAPAAPGAGSGAPNAVRGWVARLLGRPLTVSHSLVAIPISCAAPICRGTIELSLTRLLRHRRGGAVVTSEVTEVLARVSFAVRRGPHVNVEVRLDPLGIRALAAARGHRLSGTLTLIASGTKRQSVRVAVQEKR